jgi:lysophospholipase L1-like esterase
MSSLQGWSRSLRDRGAAAGAFALLTLPITLALALGLDPQSAAFAANSILPLPRTDRNSMIAHEQLLAKARQGRIDVYFAGDSITRRWGCSDAQYRELLQNWRSNFFGWNAANFGWGGDKVQNILWRLENGELEGVNPKVIVLLAGTNNLGGPSTTEQAPTQEEALVAGIRAILASMQRQAHRATIILMGILPRNDPRGNAPLMPSINRINERLARFADGNRVRYLNINGRLATTDGRLLDGMTVDGLHLSVKGYQIWAEALRPIFLELLGTPAQEDHAPLPTGDPSAP